MKGLIVISLIVLLKVNINCKRHDYYDYYEEPIRLRNYKSSPDTTANISSPTKNFRKYIDIGKGFVQKLVNAPRTVLKVIKTGEIKESQDSTTSSENKKKVKSKPVQSKPKKPKPVNSKPKKSKPVKSKPKKSKPKKPGQSNSNPIKEEPVKDEAIDDF